MIITSISNKLQPIRQSFQRKLLGKPVLEHGFDTLEQHPVAIGHYLQLALQPRRIKININKSTTTYAIMTHIKRIEVKILNVFQHLLRLSWIAQNRPSGLQYKYEKYY